MITHFRRRSKVKATFWVLPRARPLKCIASCHRLGSVWAVRRGASCQRGYWIGRDDLLQALQSPAARCFGRRSGEMRVGQRGRDGQAMSPDLTKEHGTYFLSCSQPCTGERLQRVRHPARRAAGVEISTDPNDGVNKIDWVRSKPLLSLLHNLKSLK